MGGSNYQLSAAWIRWGVATMLLKLVGAQELLWGVATSNSSGKRPKRHIFSSPAARECGAMSMFLACIDIFLLEMSELLETLHYFTTLYVYRHRGVILGAFADDVSGDTCRGG